MLIRTSRFGELDIDPEKILLFPRGIPGFEYAKKYSLIEYKDGRFNWLQAVDDPDLAFIVCDPAMFSLTYIVPKSILETLGIKKEDDLAILLIVKVDRTAQKVIPHVQAPLLFNTATREGIQWVLDKNELESSVSVIDEEKVAG